MNLSSIVYPYLSTLIGKPFLVIIFCFVCSRLSPSVIFFKLSLATTVTVLKPVSCDHVTFNYDDKKTRDVGLACWCHLSNIMPDSIFHKSIRQWITCVCFLLLLLLLFFCCFFWCGVMLQFSSGWKRWNEICHYNISWRGELYFPSLLLFRYFLHFCYFLWLFVSSSLLFLLSGLSTVVWAAKNPY